MPDPVLGRLTDLGQPAMHLLSPHRRSVSRAAAASNGCQGLARPPSETVTRRPWTAAFDRLQAGQGHQVAAGQLTVQRDRQEHRALVVGRSLTRRPSMSAISPGTPSGFPGIGDASLQQRPADFEHE